MLAPSVGLFCLFSNMCMCTVCTFSAPVCALQVQGAPYTPPGTSVPANYFRVVGPNTVGGGNVVIAQSNLFSVMGKQMGGAHVAV